MNTNMPGGQSPTGSVPGARRKALRRPARWAAAALLAGGTLAAGALTTVPARAETNPAPVPVVVTGTQVYGSSSPQFSFSYPQGYVGPEPAVSGTVTCSAVVGASATSTPITPTLPVLAEGAIYQIEPSSCSGLTAPSGYEVVYQAPMFTVSPAPQDITLASSGAPQVITPAGLPAGEVGLETGLNPTGGGSGNQVTLQIDPASEGTCDIANGGLEMDTFTPASQEQICYVDASEPGSLNYQGAESIYQVTFAPPTSGATAWGETATPVSAS